MIRPVSADRYAAKVTASVWKFRAADWVTGLPVSMQSAHSRSKR